jgi:hypothetical protein
MALSDGRFPPAVRRAVDPDMGWDGFAAPNDRRSRRQPSIRGPLARFIGPTRQLLDDPPTQALIRFGRYVLSLRNPYRNQKELRALDGNYSARITMAS